MTKGTMIAFVVLAVATGLLAEPIRGEKSSHHHEQQQQHRHHHRHVADPNSSRASRLLYSPRIRTTGNSVDMHTVLRRLRESQQHDLNDRQANAMSNAITDQSHEQPGEWKAAVPEPLLRTEQEERQLKELCHAKILQKCGSAVIEGFAEPNLPLDQKCRIRENFLHCVIKMKRRTCRQKSPQDFLFTEDYIQSLRQQILTLLWSARGCVLGMEAP